MNIKTLSLIIGFVLLTGCAPANPAPPTPTEPFDQTQDKPAPATSTFIATETLSPLTSTPDAFTPIPTLTFTPPPVASNICSDPQVVALIDSLKSAMLTSNGETLSSLVSPNGMEVRYIRYGNPITYTQEQAKFLFETTFEANWGAEPGSGEDKIGSFHDVIVPELIEVFNQPYTLHCNELKHGGATYELEWDYSGDFYSIYFPGTETNGNLDWHTWVVGIEYVNNKPYIYAMMQFFWEP